MQVKISLMFSHRTVNDLLNLLGQCVKYAGILYIAKNDDDNDIKNGEIVSCH